jgi:hydroxyacylglutathione hydrolase
MLEIDQIPVLKDNYVYLVRESESGLVGVVDPAVAEPVEARLAERGWRLTHILNTHHHMDHVGANVALKERHGCTIVGAACDRARIPGLDVAVAHGERFAFGAETAEIIEVPGHTTGHIAYWFERARALFCGDTLFALGCGRMFEGNPPMMWRSLSRIRALPDDALVHCAHEYTQSNARFALAVDGANPDLVAYSRRVDALRAEGRPTVPSRLGDEKRANPFLRADQPALAAAVGLGPSADPAEVFGALRRKKDNF